MGGSQSKHNPYPLPIPGQSGYDSRWSVTGKGKKGKEQQRQSVQNYYMPNKYSYIPQPYPYYPAQNGSYYPQFGMGQGPTGQQTMQMPVPQGVSAQQQGQVYNPAAVPPPPVAMPQPPQNAPVIPPPPQIQQQSSQQQQFQPQQQQPILQNRQQAEQMAQERAEQLREELQQQQQQQQQGPPVLPGAQLYQNGDPSGGYRPRLNNPLPTPPRDLYEMSPYRSLLRDLPNTTSILERQFSMQANQANPQVQIQGGSQLDRGLSLGSVFGSRPSREKKPRKGIFGSGKSGGGGSLSRSNTVTSFIINPAGPSAPFQVNSAMGMGMGQQMPVPRPTTPDPNVGPPVRFDHNSPLAGFMNHSPHRVMYQNHMYPSALHLLEAFKFIPQRNDLAERIRAVKEVQDVYPLSATMHDFVRKDWGQVFLTMVEEVLYLKFKQHPDLRQLLMNTNQADIIYAESNDAYWGEGPLGQGQNELGKAIVRARERLRREGYNVGSAN